MIDLKLLIKNGVHFGHQTARWSPKMEPYIWGFKNGIHLIDVMKTARQLERASKFLESIAAEGKTILLVGTKKAARDGVYNIAQELKLPYVIHRWVGGTFTNYRQVRKAIGNLQNYEQILEKSGESHYTKKELNLLKKRAGRLENIVGGIRNLSWPVGAVVVVDVRKESVVVKEANASGIPVVGLVDTNSDPTDVDYVIPANDDSPRSIDLLMNYLGQAIARGQKEAEKRPKKVVEVIETLVETLYDEEPDKRKKRAAKPTKVAAKKAPVKEAKPKAEPKEKAPAKDNAKPKAEAPKAAKENAPVKAETKAKVSKETRTKPAAKAKAADDDDAPVRPAKAKLDVPVIKPKAKKAPAKAKAKVAE